MSLQIIYTTGMFEDLSNVNTMNEIKRILKEIIVNIVDLEKYINVFDQDLKHKKTDRKSDRFHFGHAFLICRKFVVN